MEDFKKIVAGNLIRLRTAAVLTQAELGQKLNYSDKSISKWERAEAVPDAFVLKQMSRLFGVTVDYFLEEHEHAEPLPVDAFPAHKYSRKVITMVSVAGTWTLAVLLFVVLWLSIPTFSWQWIVFVYFLPATAVLLLVENSLWGDKRLNELYVTILVWGMILCLYFSFFIFAARNLWQLFILLVPSQLVIFLSFRIVKKRKK